jgi:hypothetical protein
MRILLRNVSVRYGDRFVNFRSRRISWKDREMSVKNGNIIHHNDDRTHVRSEKKWDMYAARLLTAMEEKEQQSRLSSCRILVLGFDMEGFVRIRDLLRQLYVLSVAAAPNIKQLGSIESMNLDFTHIILNFDAFIDIEHGVGALLEFRQAVPDIKIIICSSNVNGDDFGTERNCICDTTLRFPVSMRSIRAAIEA